MRGKKPSPNARHHMFHLRLNDSELEELNRKAEAANMIPCDFVRKLIGDFRVKKRTSEVQ